MWRKRRRRRRHRRREKMEETLAQLEHQLLNTGDFNTEHKFINVGENDQISTIFVNTNSKNTPIVCLHGYCGACAVWVHNIESLAKDRPLYAIDLPGFGRSSRYNFSELPDEIESQFIDLIEQWRKEMGLEKFIILGHSFGGYLSSIYALKYPERISHLILADPWGYVSRPTDEYLRNRLGRLGYFIFCNVAPKVNPFSLGRFMGKYGPWIVSKVRPDLTNKFSHENADHDVVSRYIHYSNAQTPASGELAFTYLAEDMFWAKNPLLLRITQLPDDLPMTFVYGAESWNTVTPAYTIKQLRVCSYVDVQILADAGHHLHADQSCVFNRIVSAVCRQVDNGEWQRRNDVTKSH